MAKKKKKSAPNHFQIRDLSDKDKQALEALEEFTDHRTRSKSVMEAVFRYPVEAKLAQTLAIELATVKRDYNKLQALVRECFDMQDQLREASK